MKRNIGKKLASIQRAQAAKPEPKTVEFRDSAGNVFDGSRHVAINALTKAGTFRLKPGKRHA